MARAAGFDFVDVKHCHGYLGHELLARGRARAATAALRPAARVPARSSRASARRAGPGDRRAPVRVRHAVPFRKGADGVGVRKADGRLRTPSADAERPLEARPRRTRRLPALLDELGIRWVCVHRRQPVLQPAHPAARRCSRRRTATSRPRTRSRACARQIAAIGEAQARFPTCAIVGSGYTYLQEWLPHVGQPRCATGGPISSASAGWSSPIRAAADVLAGQPLQRKQICRTFSDCTTGPRNGLVSGCFPLDPFYKKHPDAARLKRDKERHAGMTDPPTRSRGQTARRR